jgi:hypothetical protein
VSRAGVGWGFFVRVVCVHGIGKQLEGEQTLLGQWRPALQDGLTRAEATGLLADTEVGMAFYGDLFRPPGQPLAVGDPYYKERRRARFGD